MNPHQNYPILTPPMLHVHQILCTCPYPHINPYCGPMYHYMQQSLGQLPPPPTLNRVASLPKLVNITASISNQMFQSQSNIFRQDPCITINDSNTTINFGRTEPFNPVFLLDSDINRFVQFLEAGCIEAERIAVRNKDQGCFTNVQSLCRRTLTVLAHPFNTVAKVQAHGVSYVTKDFIYAYMHLINCWRLVTGYTRMSGFTPSLSCVDHELNEEFRACYAQWEERTKELTGHILRVFANLDTQVYRAEQAICAYRNMPMYYPLQFSQAPATNFPFTPHPCYNFTRIDNLRRFNMTGMHNPVNPVLYTGNLFQDQIKWVVDIEREMLGFPVRQQEENSVMNAYYEAPWPTAELDYNCGPTETGPYFLPLIEPPPGLEPLQQYNPPEPRRYDIYTNALDPIGGGSYENYDTLLRCFHHFVHGPRDDPASVQQFQDFCNAMSKSLHSKFTPNDLIFDGNGPN